MELDIVANGKVKNTAYMVCGIFDNVKSEAQRLVCFLFNLIRICSNYFQSKTVVLNNQLEHMPFTQGDLRMYNDYKSEMECEINHLRSIIEQLLDERSHHEGKIRPGKCWESEIGEM